MDPERRGEYSGVAEVFSTLGGRWAPALFTLLAMSWHPAALPGAGWLVIAGDRGRGGVGLHPSVRMAERFLEREGIAPVGGAAVEEEAPSPSLVEGLTPRGDAVKLDSFGRLLPMDMATLALPDLDDAEVVVPAPDAGPGNWAGAASAFVADGEV